jgi:hypothetical protein
MKNTRTRTRKGTAQLCLVLLGAALVVMSMVTLSTPSGTSDGAFTAEKKEEEELQRRDFVTLTDIELLGTAVGLVSPRDDAPPRVRAMPAWPSWPPRPASPTSPHAPLRPAYPPSSPDAPALPPPPLLHVVVPSSPRVRCPPGYGVPNEGIISEKDRAGHSEMDICALQFFRSSIADVAYYSDASVSVSRLRAIVRGARVKLGLFSLAKDFNGVTRWKHLEGQGLGFWSTSAFHRFMSKHLKDIASLLANNTTSYFVINCFDEAQHAGSCSNLQSLQTIHPNVQRGLINRADDNVPVWSLSKVRGCHVDLLIPHPDIFAMVERNKGMGTLSPWRDRQDVAVFRGSSTGFGNAQTNLRAKVVRDLTNKDRFDVGITAAIQGMNTGSVADLMKPKIDRMDWSRFRYILDVDGNAHSFDRPLAIARANATMLRVNVWTDLFSDGLIAGKHCFDVDPTRVEHDEWSVSYANVAREDWPEPTSTPCACSPYASPPPSPRLPPPPANPLPWAPPIACPFPCEVRNSYDYNHFDEYKPVKYVVMTYIWATGSSTQYVCLDTYGPPWLLPWGFGAGEAVNGLTCRWVTVQEFFGKYVDVPRAEWEEPNELPPCI